MMGTLLATKMRELILNRKLQLESGLYSSIRSLFYRIAFGNFASGLAYKTEIKGILERHYNLVFDEFIDDYRKANDVVMSPLQQAIMLSEVNGLVNERSMKQSELIVKSIDKQFAKANDAMRLMTAETNNPTRTRQNITYANLIRRIEPIACYETQWAAETARFMEVVYLTGRNGISIKEQQYTYKRWDAMGDDKMRRWHADADSQVVDLDEPFIVNGEMLMRPGDTSLGATASNIINCRCTVSYDVSHHSLVTAIHSDAPHEKYAMLDNERDTAAKYRTIEIDAQQIQNDMVDHLDYGKKLPNDIVSRIGGDSFTLPTTMRDADRAMLNAFKNESMELTAAQRNKALGIDAHPSLLKLGDRMDKFIYKGSANENVKAWRFITSDNAFSEELLKMKAGDIMSPNCIQSTTLLPSVAEIYAKFSRNVGKSIVFEIDIPKGSRALYIDAMFIKRKMLNVNHIDEFEVVLPSTTKYKMKEIVEKDGYKLVKVEYISPEFKTESLRNAVLNGVGSITIKPRFAARIGICEQEAYMLLVSSGRKQEADLIMDTLV